VSIISSATNLHIVLLFLLWIWNASTSLHFACPADTNDATNAATYWLLRSLFFSIWLRDLFKAWAAFETIFDTVNPVTSKICALLGSRASRRQHHLPRMSEHPRLLLLWVQTNQDWQQQHPHNLIPSCSQGHEILVLPSKLFNSLSYNSVYQSKEPPSNN